MTREEIRQKCEKLAEIVVGEVFDDDVDLIEAFARSIRSEAMNEEPRPVLNLLSDYKECITQLEARLEEIEHAAGRINKWINVETLPEAHVLRQLMNTIQKHEVK